MVALSHQRALGASVKQRPRSISIDKLRPPAHPHTRFLASTHAHSQHGHNFISIYFVTLGSALAGRVIVLRSTGKGDVCVRRRL